MPVKLQEVTATFLNSKKENLRLFNHQRILVVKKRSLIVDNNNIQLQIEITRKGFKNLKKTL